MEKLIINGKKELSGKISISGSKNSTLPILAAAILSKKTILSNVPLVKDIFTMIDLLKFIDGQLDVVGLMCIPPFDQDPENHFKNLKSLADENNLSKLSMGMTADYVKACKYNADYIRVGSKIFGARK